MWVGFANFGWFLSIEIQNFLQPWRRNSKKMSVGFADSGWFQSIKIENFLQPWWRNSNKCQWVSLILEDFRVSKFKFSSSKVKEFQRNLSGFRSFWMISEYQNSKFSSTMVKNFQRNVSGFLQISWGDSNETSVGFAHSGWFRISKFEILFNNGEGISENFQ